MTLLSAGKLVALKAATRLGYVILKASDFERFESEKGALKAKTLRLGKELNEQRRTAEQLRKQGENLLGENERLREEAEQLRGDIARLRHSTEGEEQTLSRVREELVAVKVAAEQRYDYQLLMEYQAKLFGFRDADPTFYDLYERVRSWTMTSIEKLHAMYTAVQHVLKADIPGDIVECGVWRGGSMMIAALTALALGDTSRRLFLFDTFEGHPPPDKDKDGLTVNLEWQSRRLTDQSSDWARVSIEEVRRNLESTGYPMDKVILVKGKVQDTVPAAAPDAVALLRLDTDWYDSTSWELKNLYPRLSDHGVLILDDYGAMAGQKQATDDFFAANREILLLNRIDFAGRLAVKPARHGP